MPHEMNDLGYPTDPELRALEFRLGDLAYEWRGAYGDQAHQDRLVEEYHETMRVLYQRGWDAVLDIEAELPDEFLPEAYLRRHGRFS